jgi:hypothetical protein
MFMNVWLALSNMSTYLSNLSAASGKRDIRLGNADTDLSADVGLYTSPAGGATVTKICGRFWNGEAAGRTFTINIAGVTVYSAYVAAGAAWNFDISFFKGYAMTGAQAVLVPSQTANCTVNAIVHGYL